MPSVTEVGAKLIFSVLLKGYIYYVFGYYPSSCLYLKCRPVSLSKHNVSETEFCLRHQAKPTQLGPVGRAGPYLRTQNTEYSLRNYIIDKDKTMDNVQKRNIYTNVQSKQTFRS
jgi:hypothetical protein